MWSNGRYQKIKLLLELRETIGSFVVAPKSSSVKASRRALESKPKGIIKEGKQQNRAPPVTLHPPNRLRQNWLCRTNANPKSWNPTNRTDCLCIVWEVPFVAIRFVRSTRLWHEQECFRSHPKLGNSVHSRIAPLLAVTVPLKGYDWVGPSIGQGSVHTWSVLMQFFGDRGIPSRFSNH